MIWIGQGVLNLRQLNFLILIFSVFLLTSSGSSSLVENTDLVTILHPNRTINMALSLEDFLKYSSKQRAEDQEVRAKERALDSKVRAEEHESNLNAMKDLIKSGVKEEVSRVLKPIQDNNEKRIGSLEADMKEIKSILKSGQSSSQPSQSHDHTRDHHPDQASQHEPPHEQLPGGDSHNDVQPNNDVNQALANVRKIISLQPIFPKDVDRQYRMHSNIQCDKDAMLSSVREYLHYELKCKYSDQPRIVRVFTPANTPNYDRLYAEFETEHSANFVASFARFIKKPDHQVSLYVPSTFQPRFHAFNTEAQKIRKAPGLGPGDIKTKVRYGVQDFQLFTKPRNGRWTLARLDTSMFPPLQSPSSQSSASPPPGRPRDAPPSPPRPASLSTASPPPGRPRDAPHSLSRSKRGATSPLENGKKSHKMSSPSHTPPIHQQESPHTPPYTPSLSAPNPGSVQPSDLELATPPSTSLQPNNLCSSLN